jgi:hypothetical protein
MLPLEGVFFAPSLLIVPLAVVALLVLKRRDDYELLWKRASVACLVLAAIFTFQVWGARPYSERDHSPDNPGGPSSGPLAVLGVFVIETCVVIPAFPLLVALMALPPRGWPRYPLVLTALLAVGACGWLIMAKNAAYIADYREAKQQELVEHEAWRQQQIRP